MEVWLEHGGVSVYEHAFEAFWMCKELKMASSEGYVLGKEQ